MKDKKEDSEEIARNSKMMTQLTFLKKLIEKFKKKKSPPKS